MSRASATSSAPMVLLSTSLQSRDSTKSNGQHDNLSYPYALSCEMYVYQVHERGGGDMTGGSRIRELRTRRGLLQRELAEMAGVTESAVRNYELGLRAPRPQHLEALARALGVDPVALTDYGVETARDALEVLFRLEESFGARPEADAAGARVVVDPVAPGAQKLDAAVRAWAAMRARRDSGEISEEEYLDWKRSAAHC